MGQFADKPHRIGDHHIQRIADRQQAGGSVQRIEQPVVGGDTRAGDGVEQRGLARVGVAHDGHHGDLVFHPALPLGAPVRLQLRLAGALGADRSLAAGARLPLQMGPHAHQPRQQVLVLCQLHL